MMAAVIGKLSSSSPSLRCRMALKSYVDMSRFMAFCTTTSTSASSSVTEQSAGFILNTSGAPRRVGDIQVWRSHSSLLVHHLTRCFHVSSAVQAKRNFEESGFMKTPRKPKREKKEKLTQAPVEAPYVPPKPKKIVRSSPGKIIDIFDGMTLAELGKRTGEGIDILQDILSNIGEQVSLEFQPITMDVAELIAMISSRIQS